MSKQVVNVVSTGFVTGTTAKTVMMYIAPTGGAVISRWGIQFGGTTPTDAPITVEILKGAGGGSGTSVTPVKVAGNADAARGTANQNYSSEPSGGTVIGRHLIHPQSGAMFPANVDLAGGGTFSIRVTAGTSVSCTPSIEAQE